MLIRHKKEFNMGVVLAISFFGVLILIFSPIFNGKNGLEYSDDLFNKLSKGSSYFIPKLTQQVQKDGVKTFSTAVKLDKPDMAERAAKMLTTAGVEASTKDSEVKVSGNLDKLLGAILKDSDAMYHNDGKVVSSRYGFDEKEAMTLWWNLLSKMDKAFKKDKKVEESNLVLEVMKKGIEPAFNYYGIQAESVSSKALTMIALLVFYVAYTMWWGYAIFYMFDGIGLSMKKAKVKKEV